MSVWTEKCGTVNRSTPKKSSFLDYSDVEIQVEILWISHLNGVVGRLKTVLIKTE
jgi:hypothetical protein